MPSPLKGTPRQALSGTSVKRNARNHPCVVIRVRNWPTTAIQHGRRGAKVRSPLKGTVSHHLWLGGVKVLGGVHFNTVLLCFAFIFGISDTI